MNKLMITCLFLLFILFNVNGDRGYGGGGGSYGMKRKSSGPAQIILALGIEKEEIDEPYMSYGGGGGGGYAPQKRQYQQQSSSGYGQQMCPCQY